MNNDIDISDEQPVAAKEPVPAKGAVKTDEQTGPIGGATRFARVNDITPVFNSSADAVKRLSTFVSAFEQEAIPDIFDNMTLLQTDDTFEQMRRSASRQMIDAFRESPDFQTAASEWPEMKADERVSLLNRISALQGQVFGFNAPRVVPFYESPKDGDIFHGRFNPKLDMNGVLEVNIHPNSKFNSFPTALEMTLTQNSLAWLDDLADGFDHGALTEANPLYKQARVLSIYRGIMDVADNGVKEAENLGGYVKTASQDMAEGISLEIVTAALEDTQLNLRRRVPSLKPKGMKPA